VLRLRRLNDAKKLAGKAIALDDMKRWVMAVGSGKVERVDRLVRVNLARKGGIRNLLDLYDRAAKQVYHPRNYTEEDDLRGLLLWRLGGARVAGIAHHALNLPSLSTLRRCAIIPQLLISALAPMRLDVETNVISNFEGIYELLKTHQVVHQIFMLDELKIEERLRHNPDSNKILGRLSTGRARSPWPRGQPGPDHEGQGPGQQLEGPAPNSRAKGQLKLELALGVGPGPTWPSPI